MFMSPVHTKQGSGWVHVDNESKSSDEDKPKNSKKQSTTVQGFLEKTGQLIFTRHRQIQKIESEVVELQKRVLKVLDSGRCCNIDESKNDPIYNAYYNKLMELWRKTKQLSDEDINIELIFLKNRLKSEKINLENANKGNGKEKYNRRIAEIDGEINAIRAFQGRHCLPLKVKIFTSVVEFGSFIFKRVSESAFASMGVIASLAGKTTEPTLSSTEKTDEHDADVEDAVLDESDHENEVSDQRPVNAGEAPSNPNDELSNEIDGQDNDGASNDLEDDDQG